MNTGCINSKSLISQNTISPSQKNYQTWAKEYAPAILKTLFDAPSFGEYTCFPSVPTEKNKYPGIPSSLTVLNYCTGEFLEVLHTIPPVDSQVAMDTYRAYYKSRDSIVAVELSSGTVAWEHDFLIEWPIGGYRAPVLYKDWMIYITMVGWPKGTSGCIVAMNKETGETAWRYQTNDPMSYWLHIQNDVLYCFQEKFDSSIGDYTSKMVALDLQTQEPKCEITIPGSLERNDFYPTQHGILVETFMDKFNGGNIYVLDSQTGEYNVVMQSSQQILGPVLAYADDSVYIYHHDGTTAFSVSSGELLWNYTKPQEVTGERPLICKIDSSLLGFFYNQQVVLMKQDTGDIVKTIQIQPLNKESKQSKEAILSLLQDTYFTLKEEEVEYSVAPLHIEPSPKPPAYKPAYPVVPVEWDYEMEVHDSWKKSPSSLITVCDNQIYLIENDTTIKVFDLVTGNILQSKTVPYSIHSKLVVNDTAIYYKDNQKTICALDRETMKPIWTHTLSEEEWTGHSLEDMKLFNNKLFVVTYTRDSKYKQEENLGPVCGNLITLNKDTGEEEWRYSLPDNTGIIDSNLFTWNHFLFFAHYEMFSSITGSRTGWYGGTVYKVNMNTFSVTPIPCPKMIFNGPLLNTQSYLYGGHHSGDIFRIDPALEVITKVFDSNKDKKGFDWKPFQYADETILIRGVGPLQCYELATMQPKWTCVLPHQLHIASNILGRDENHVLVADENSNLHVIDKQTGIIKKSYSFETSYRTSLKKNILYTGHGIVLTTLKNNRVFVSVFNMDELSGGLDG